MKQGRGAGLQVDAIHNGEGRLSLCLEDAQAAESHLERIGIRMHAVQLDIAAEKRAQLIDDGLACQGRCDEGPDHAVGRDQPEKDEEAGAKDARAAGHAA